MSQTTDDPRIEAFLAEARRDPEPMLIVALEHLAAARHQIRALAEVNCAQAATITALTDLVAVLDGGAA